MTIDRSSWWPVELENKHRQLSVAWMGIPSFGKMHIPSCDFASMISPEQYRELVLPVIKKEVKLADHNIFHMDGKGVANHRRSSGDPA